MMDIGIPNKTLERELRQAIVGKLHELLPEFRTHVSHCPACDLFHDWMTWKHVDRTNEWVAQCPQTGAAITVAFRFGSAAAA